MHSDALERVFSTILRTMVESVQLQHFNRNHMIASDYLQFTLEHVDLVNYVYSSRSVAYENFRFQRIVSGIVGGIMNWLSNLAQSNRQIDIRRDWVICLKISRMEEVQRGMGKKRKLSEYEVQFLIDVDVQVNNSVDKGFQNCVPTPQSPEFNQLTMVTFKHVKETDDEEYRLFGTPSSSSLSSPQCSDNKSSDDEDEMDDDTGMSFNPFFNVEALNFFVNNELSNSEIIIDYFNEGCFGGVLSNECLLVAMYVQYFHLTQSNNFK